MTNSSISGTVTKPRPLSRDQSNRGRLLRIKLRKINTARFSYQYTGNQLGSKPTFYQKKTTE